VLSDEKYILFTTYRRDGTPVATPVWVVPLDGGKLGFWTSSGSGKAKRLAHSDRVTIQPCDARGRVRPGSAAVDGTARIVTGSEFDAIHSKVKAKYGFTTKLTKLVGTLLGILKGKRIPYGDRGVVITPTG
jgi:PPOX class probable F420-dependent enzyme